MMLDPPSAFAPLDELTTWLERCRELRDEFGHDSGALADINRSEREVRAALARRTGQTPRRRTV
jgi:hypothetical protein